MVYSASTVVTTLSVWMCLHLAGVTARPKDYRSAVASGGGAGAAPILSTSGEVVGSKADAGEPSCEQLRAMWRFSKRQSRAAEMTNEIPTYRDPFANNIWQTPYDSYARSRSMAGMRVGNGYRGGHRPVYGRIVHKAPLSRLAGHPDRNRAFEEVVRLYGTVYHRGLGLGPDSSRRQTQFRLPGGHVGRGSLTPHSGSFQHLKELIQTERARELQQQRLAEEMAARAAVLQASGNPSESSRRQYAHTSRYAYDGNDDDLMGDEAAMRQYMMVGLDVGEPGSPLLKFPDPVAPPASMSRGLDPRSNSGYYENYNTGYDRDDSEDQMLQSAFSSNSGNL